MPAFPLAAVAAGIRRRWLFILLVAAAAGAIGYTVAKVARPPEFDASVVLKVADIRMREAGQPMAPVGFTTLLANRSLAQRLIAEFELDRRFGFTPATMLGSIRLVEDRNASLVTARIRLPDAALAAKVANRFAELAIELNRTLNQKDTAVARDLIKAQLDESAVRLQDARAAMLAFRREAQVELSKADITAVLEQRQELADWKVTLSSEKARLAQLERDLSRQPAALPMARSSTSDADLVAAINQAAQDPAPARGTTAPPDTLRQPAGAPPPGSTSEDDATRRRAEAERQEAERTRAATKRLAEARLESDAVRRAEDVPTLPGGDTRANPVRLLLEYQVAASRARVAALEQRRTEMTDVLRLDASRSQNLDRLYRGEEELRRRDLEVRVAEKAYADLSERYEEARLQVASRSAELQIVDPALVPQSEAVWRDSSVAMVCALLGGIAVMGVIALVALIRSWRFA